MIFIFDGYIKQIKILAKAGADRPIVNNSNVSDTRADMPAVSNSKISSGRVIEMYTS